MPPRCVPVAVKGKLREELHRLEELEVLKKEDRTQTMKVRVCIEAHRQNPAIKRRHYPLV